MIKLLEIYYLNNLLMFISHYLQVKMMTAIKGSSYGDGLVTEDECQTKLSDLANSMMLVHNYTKGVLCIHVFMIWFCENRHHHQL